jgi:hypothetical protein
MADRTSGKLLPSLLPGMTDMLECVYEVIRQVIWC